MKFLRSLLIILPIVLFFFFYIFLPKGPDFPEELIGVWTTDDEKYKDKYLNISRNFIFLGIDEKRKSTLSITEFTEKRESGEWTFSCLNENGTPIDMTFIVQDNNGLTSLKLKYQEDIVWRKLELEAITLQQEEQQNKNDLASVAPIIVDKKNIENKKVTQKEEEKKVVIIEKKVKRKPLQPRKVVLGLQPNSTSLTASGSKVLSEFVQKLKLYPRATIYVKGFVSAKTNSLSNIKLSEKRAKAVEQLLLKAGIDREQIEIIGMGNQDPIASNDTTDGREKNRRVEIEVINDGI